MTTHREVVRVNHEGYLPSRLCVVRMNFGVDRIVFLRGRYGVTATGVVLGELVRQVGHAVLSHSDLVGGSFRYSRTHSAGRVDWDRTERDVSRSFLLREVHSLSRVGCGHIGVGFHGHGTTAVRVVELKITGSRRERG